MDGNFLYKLMVTGQIQILSKINSDLYEFGSAAQTVRY